MSETRKYETGATRDTEEGKNDYEGFLHPLVIRAFGDYMTKHRKQSDGQLRASDNWQKGIPKADYLKSNIRHLLDLWTIHRGYKVTDKKGDEVTIQDACCGIMFNAMGYLLEWIKSPVLPGSGEVVNAEFHFEPSLLSSDDADLLRRLLEKIHATAHGKIEGYEDPEPDWLSVRNDAMDAIRKLEVNE